MNKLLVFIIVGILGSGCSSIKMRNTPKSNNPDNVDLNLNTAPSQPQNIELQPTEETVRIGEHGGDTYGADQNTNTSSHAENRRLRIALVLGPGIYRTINYVSFLKILERQNLAPDIVTGTGFGAIVAAMYATGMTPEVIEWNFYKYFKEKKKNKPFDKEWSTEVDEVLLSKFKNLNIQDTKKKLFLTLYNHRTGKTYYFDKGNIRDLLLQNLRLSNNPVESKSGQIYSAPFEKEVFNAKLLQKLGAEFTISADVLGSKFDFDTTNEFLLGVLGKAASRIQKEKREFDYSVTFPLGTMNLDSTKDSSLHLQKTYEFMQKQLPQLQKKIQLKLERLASQGNN